MFGNGIFKQTLHTLEEQTLTASDRISYLIESDPPAFYFEGEKVF